MAVSGIEQLGVPLNNLMVRKIYHRWILEEGVWQGKWDWTRQPSGRADGDLAKLMSDLNGLPLDEAQDDF
ncbi:hypothetical protein Tco_1147507 [Tanacetum coccineum]